MATCERQAGERAALVYLVEGLIAADEREGGRTQRDLAELIVSNVLSHLGGDSEGIGRNLRS